MKLKFPAQPEIKLDSSPITEVICQIRFPPILSIPKRLGEFQDYVRDKFPETGVQHSAVLESAQGAINSEVVNQPKVFQFISDDKKSNIAVGLDFYALSTSNYTHWADFLESLVKANEAVLKVFKPNYASRIGLRYINQLNVDNTGAKSFDEVLDLLRKELTVLYRIDVWSPPSQQLIHLQLQDGDAKLGLRLAIVDDEKNMRNCVLDFDYYEEGRITLGNLSERSERFHRTIYNAFRWCFLDEEMAAFRHRL